ncbi:MAG: lipoyl synthase [Deltaproteobacteria bacterium]|nr:lipoyl synthase [Deltaproteobacteria bacterium]
MANQPSSDRVSADDSAGGGNKRLPGHLRRRLGHPGTIHGMKRILRQRGLHTVCESARCPNIGECFSRPTATFMILGDVCTRTCGFCAVEKRGPPSALDPGEPLNVALAAKDLGLRHVVVTSVTRDDLPMGGAGHFALTIRALRDTGSDIFIEVLTPDFNGDQDALDVVLNAGPDIFNHNVETVPRLYPLVRPQAGYSRSLNVLSAAKKGGTLTKSGLMVGLGETREEVRAVLNDLLNSGCDAVTIGQYLRPALTNLEVKAYVAPEVFKEYEEYAKGIGMRYVYSGPFVRSSYNAEEVFKDARGLNR